MPSQIALSESPLAEASPRSLDEFFSRDPLDLSDQDLDVIVAELRRQRKQFLVAEAQPKAPRGASKAPKTPASLALELGDLGL